MGSLPLTLFVATVVLQKLCIVRLPAVWKVTRAGTGRRAGLLTGETQKLEWGALLLMLKLTAGLRRVPGTHLSGDRVPAQNVTSCLVPEIRSATRLTTSLVQLDPAWPYLTRPRVHGKGGRLALLGSG